MEEAEDVVVQRFSSPGASVQGCKKEMRLQ